MRADSLKVSQSARTTEVICRRAGVAVMSLILVLVAAVSSSVPAKAEDDSTQNSARKIGDQRAIRLSYAEGGVRVSLDGQILAEPAVSNMPIFEGTEIATTDSGRAELQFEDGSSIRLSPNSILVLSVLQQQGTNTRTEIVMQSGLAYFELQPSSADHSFRVSYGSASFSASSFAVVRVLRDQAPGNISVFSGNVHIEQGSSQLDLHGGESVNIDTHDFSLSTVAESIEPDSWDSWNADRDQAENSDASHRTAAASSLSNSVLGVNELDANGSWFNLPGQGMIWSPYEAQNQGMAWDPYGFGSWVPYPGYGYIWASGYSWGFSPYQCGLWNFYEDFGWGWAPGLGCSPWYQFQGGYYGGGGYYNIGLKPRGYVPPKRPLPVQTRIHPGPIQGGKTGGTIVARVPIVPVDRRPPGSGIPISKVPQPIVIAGHVVEPLRPVAPRQNYPRSNESFLKTSPTPVWNPYRNGVRGPRREAMSPAQVSPVRVTDQDRVRDPVRLLVRSTVAAGVGQPRSMLPLPSAVAAVVAMLAAVERAAVVAIRVAAVVAVPTSNQRKSETPGGESPPGSLLGSMVG